MQTTVCEQVRAWLYPTAGAAQSAPPRHLAEHVAACPLCRGALLALAVALRPEGADLLASTSCASCEEQLDAFIDRERAEGAERARSAFPHVWWHLWTCASCAEAYDLARKLVEAHDGRPLAALALPPQQRPQATIQPPGDLRRRAMAMQAQLGVAWGDNELGMAIAEANAAGRAVRLYLLSAEPSSCRITATVQPPSTGTATLVLGQQVYEADLDHAGWAVFDQLPADQVATAEQFDLSLLFDEPPPPTSA